jgi:type II secretory pathway pseudopilin PulG
MKTAERCVTIIGANDNSLMSLRGQGGYAMAALLVSLAVMAVLMSVALPVWRHEAQREKEEELVWRGQQYIRAIRLFQAKTQTLPTSADLLVQGHYLRKKFKDPITNDEFEYLGAAGAPGQTGQTGAAGQSGRGSPQSSAQGSPQSSAQGSPQSSPPGSAQGSPPGRGSQFPTGAASSPQGSALTGGTIPGGMMGVRSKSKNESIRLYLGRNHYNEWTFLFVSQQPGGPGGRGLPGGPGGRGLPGGPGGRGQPGRGGIQPPNGPGGRGGNPSPFGRGGRI